MAEFNRRETEESRAKSDIELIRGGAEYVVDEKGSRSLDVTGEQYKKIKREGEKGGEKNDLSDFLAIPEYIDINEPPIKELATAARDGDKNARLFFAELQLIELYPEDDRRFLSALKEISRDVLASLSKLGKNTEETIKSLTSLAKVFNDNRNERFLIQIPRIGDNIDYAYMVPSTQIRTVKKVVTWAVRNNKGIAEYKAEVE